MNPNILYIAGGLVALYAVISALAENKDKILALLKKADMRPPLPIVRPGSAEAIARQAPGKYMAVQKMLLDARDICSDCPEALAAIDAAIKATVAMVVREVKA